MMNGIAFRATEARDRDRNLWKEARETNDLGVGPPVAPHSCAINDSRPDEYAKDPSGSAESERRSSAGEIGGPGPGFVNMRGTARTSAQDEVGQDS